MEEDIVSRDYLSEYGDISYEVSKYLPRATLQSLTRLSRQLLETNKRVTFLKEAIIPLDKLFILKNVDGYYIPRSIYPNLIKFNGRILVKYSQLPYVIQALDQLKLNTLDILIILDEDEVQNFTIENFNAFFSLIYHRTQVSVTVKQRGFVDTTLMSVVFKKPLHSLLRYMDYAQYSDIVHMRLLYLRRLSPYERFSFKTEVITKLIDINDPENDNLSVMTFTDFVRNSREQQDISHVNILYEDMTYQRGSIISSLHKVSKEQRDQIKALYLKHQDYVTFSYVKLDEYITLFSNAHIFAEIVKIKTFNKVKDKYKNVPNVVVVLGESRKINSISDDTYHINYDEASNLLEKLREYDNIFNVNIVLSEYDEIHTTAVLEFLELCNRTYHQEVDDPGDDNTILNVSNNIEDENIYSEVFTCKYVISNESYYTTKALYITPIFVDMGVVNKINNEMIDVHYIEIRISDILNYNSDVYSEFVPPGLLLSLDGLNDIDDIDYLALSSFITLTPNFTYISFSEYEDIQSTIQILQKLYVESGEVIYPHITFVNIDFYQIEEEEDEIENSMIRVMFPNAEFI